MYKTMNPGLVRFIKVTATGIALSLLAVPLKSQLIFQSDTIKIQEVVITRKQITSEQPGFKFYDIAPLRMADYPLFSLTDVLNNSTPLFIKNYGSGGTATSSFRGTSAGHTQITWNGININDPMLGQSDFSLLPSGMVDNVMVSFGGASMDIGDGAIGGIINLENEPVWRKGTLIDGIAGMGSFGRYLGLIKLRTGTSHFQSVTRAFVGSSKNNFRYLAETDTAPKTREHNGTLQKSFMQELYLRRSKNVLSARIWYQSASRDLPGSTQYGYAGEEQKDESFRTLINYDIIDGKTEYFTSAAFMLTNLDYVSQLYSIDSRNNASIYVIKGGMTTRLGDYSRLKIVMNNELNAINSNNYLEKIMHNKASVTLSLERKKGKRFGAVILLRETLCDDALLVPDFSAGGEYRVIRNEEHFLKMNVSRNSKIPSLNDRFWNPGGNPELKNEYAYSYEIGYKLSQKLSGQLNIIAEVNHFRNYIRDLIQWRPGESYYWVADNIGSVNSSGIESSVSVKYILYNLSVNMNAGYSYTRARETNTETPGTDSRQLIYIPKNQAQGSIHLEYNDFYTIWRTTYTGRTFTNADNSEYLENYSLNTLAGGMRFNFNKNLLDFSLRIDNIFDISYQTIAWYPQPGRSYFLTLSYQFGSGNE